MSQRGDQVVTTKKVGATLAAAAKAAPSDYQYTIVSFDGSGDLATPANASTRAQGVLQNKVENTGEAGRVAIEGMTKIKMMESCDEGEGIVADPAGTGQGSVADADGEYLAGTAHEAASAGDIIEMKLCIGAAAVGDES